MKYILLPCNSWCFKCLLLSASSWFRNPFYKLNFFSNFYLGTIIIRLLLYNLRHIKLQYLPLEFQCPPPISHLFPLFSPLGKFRPISGLLQLTNFNCTCFFVFHLWERIFCICLPHSDWLYSSRYSLIPTT